MSEECTVGSVIIGYWESTYNPSQSALKGDIEFTPKIPYTGINKGDILVSDSVPYSEFEVYALNPLKIYCKYNLPTPSIPLGSKFCVRNKKDI